MARFLLIGLDGFEPTLAQRWMDAGRLPHLARLRARGAYLPCASTTPPATFPAWTTCVTGVNPGRHGIVDFTEMVQGDYRVRFINSTWRKAPALWQTLSNAGKRSVVLGVPATYPPDPLNGLMVAGFDSPVCSAPDASFVYPPERFHEVRAWRFAEFQESQIGPGWHARALESLLRKIDDKEAIARRLVQHEEWDFFMAVFGESDTVAHHFWLFHDPDSPRHRTGFEDAIQRVYERLDACVGRLMEDAGDAVVGVVSDHGFGGAGTGVVHLNNWLAQEGCLRFGAARESLLKQIGLRCVPQRWRGMLFRRLGRLASSAESKSRFAGIEWNATQAFSEELNYFPSIRINLQGREPRGTVAPKAYDAVCAELCARLEQWEVVKKAWRRDELFSGPYVDRAPDIVLELALENGYSHSVLRSRGGEPFRRLRPEEYLGGKERGMTGNHRPTGVLFLSEATQTHEARLEDIAPTVLGVLGVPGPPMEGHNLLGPDLPSSRGSSIGKEQPYGAAEEKEIQERLRGLGYF
jgi:predicted AlkP superfamily phosphohydrolase/phosphomutase